MPKTKWTGVIIGGLLAGVVINAGELALQPRAASGALDDGVRRTGQTSHRLDDVHPGQFPGGLFCSLGFTHGCGPAMAPDCGLLSGQG